MPCQLCSKQFTTIPCKHKDGILSKKELSENNYFNSLTQSDMMPYVEIAYKTLYQECPCKECIVKMICDIGRLCRDFKDILAKNRPIFYRCYEKLTSNKIERFRRCS